MSEITIITNNVPRDVTYGYELTAEEQKEFDYLSWDKPDQDNDIHNFFRYKGQLYDLEEFTPPVPSPEIPAFGDWSVYQPDTFFSGILIRYVENFERVVVGRYYT